MLSVVRSSLITLLFCALIGLCPLVQAQTAPGCSSSFTGGTFTLTPQNVSLASTASGSKRRLLQASPGSYGGPTGTGCSGTPVFTLSDGVLTDQEDRTGGIVANSQFQFDNPVQAGAITTEFSACPNNTLAVTGSSLFYSCTSGTFANLYNANIEPALCTAVYLIIQPCRQA